METHGIRQALREGCELDIFLAANRLRIVTLTKDGEVKGYGEHPFAEGALLQANKDFLADHRPYGGSYGKGKKYPRFARGAPRSSGLLDDWIFRGNKLNCRLEDGQIIATFKGSVKGKDIDIFFGKAKMAKIRPL